MLMRWIVAVVIGCLMLLGGCGSAEPTPTPSLKHSILGTWKFIDAEENGQQLPNEPNVIITYDFQPDGTVILNRLSTTAPVNDPTQSEQLISTYQFISDNEINLTIEGDTRQLQVSITGNTLTLSSQSQAFNGKAVFERMN